MNQHGLMFTLEVMISIAILATAIGVVITGNNPEIEIGNSINFVNQSERINAVYFNETYTSTSNGELIICGNYWKYSTGTILEHNICEGYE